MALTIDLSGQVAVVTGASKGLGQAMAVALASAGVDIVGVSRTSMEKTKLKVEQHGKTFTAVPLDLSTLQPQQLNPIPEWLAKADILVNNAGMIMRNSAFKMTSHEWQSVLDLNLSSVFYLSQAVSQHWVTHGKKGKIINIASMLSYQGGINVASYTASKSAIKGLTMALANEWAPHGINVNAIAPGYMETDNTEALRQNKERFTQILDRIPAGRWGLPDDLSGAICFLASPWADYIHGITLPVDGGFLSR